MIELLLRMLCGATLGLALVLLVRRPARRVFGAGPAFMLWLLPLVLALAPLLPEEVAPRAMIVVPGLTVTPHLVAPVAERPFAIDWMQGLLAIWLVGAVGALLRLVAYYVRLLRGLRRLPETWACTLIEAVPNLDVRRLRVNDAGPAVLWALPRPLVLLPADFPKRFSDVATRELVLRHEITHARRGDAWWSLAMEIAFALLWFHPLAWLARSRFRLDQELACDAASLRTLPRRTVDYVRALLDSVAVQPVPALISWLSEPQLKERIAMISRIPPGALRRRAGFVAIAAILAGGLYVGGGRTPVFAAIHAASVAPSVDVTWKNAHPPHYPAEAILKAEQGMVMLDVTLDARGHVSKVAVDPKYTTAATVLQSAAINAAKGWRYAPGHKGGKAVGGVVRIPVNFALGGGASVGESPKQAAIHASAADSSPRLDYQTAPEYPAKAVDEGEQGIVMLDIFVNADGQVTKAAVDPAKSTAPVALQMAAVEAANNWLFYPAMRSGYSVDGRIEVPVTFLLQPHSLRARAIRATTVHGKKYYSCVECRSLSSPRELNR